METKEVVSVMSNYVNSFNCEYKQFAETMGYEHRTLQQNFTKLCVAWLKHLAETNSYDLRNQASVEFAKSIQEQLDTVALPLI